MKTKSGETVPRSLATSLREHPRIEAAWKKLRPSCQHDYVTRIRNAKTPDARSRALASILRLTRSYGARHPG